MADRERQVLAFAAAHRLIVFEQIRMMLGLDRDAAARLVERLADASWLRRVRLAPRDVGFYVITGEGLAALGSRLQAPAVELVRVRHAVGVGWAWVHIREEMTEGEQLMTEREMRAYDAAGREGGGLGGGRGGGGRFGLRVAGTRAPDAGGFSYPDLVLRRARGLTAVHVQLGFAPRVRLVALLTAYGADPRFVAVRFVVGDDQIGRAVQAAADTVALSGMVYVTRMELR